MKMPPYFVLLDNTLPLTGSGLLKCMILKDSTRLTRNMQDPIGLPKIPKNLKELLRTPRTLKDFQELPQDSQRLLRTPQDSRLPETTKDSPRLLKTFQDSP